MKQFLSTLFMLSVIFASGQQTFEVDWDQSTTEADATFTIETGDTIIWTWANQSPHDVVASPGETDAPGDFGSEIIIGTGQELCVELKSANRDVIDAEIVGSSDEIIFDGDEGYEQTN